MGAPPITVVEVGLRDGLQGIAPFVPTDIKVQLLNHLYAAGVRRAEVSSFVNADAVPQLADAAQLLEAANQLTDFDPQVLVPSLRQAEAAIAAGARHLAFVFSVSEPHNLANVRRSPTRSIEDYRALVRHVPARARIRINLATSFDCPFAGAIDPELTLEVIGRVAAIRADVEIALCDTTGRVTPDAVNSLASAALKRFPEIRSWAFHGHDTYGLGVANALAAWHAGIRVIDASFGGLGGCPFAPGASGNVATEDVIWTFHRMGVDTGLDLEAMVDAALLAVALPGACAGGRVRDALCASRRRERESTPAESAAIGPGKHPVNQ
jgi:hydroxymethylglutaryl-CoA lyase